ncbi:MULTISPECIES: hypothetical protein [Thermoactinomyces]|uniref:Uncharacterized protein n=1 Tax=Thermoactinomyces vulgaris TaxID=2026 RepID=A0ABS0QL53_THEVU|nr:MULTISPECIES: hypothetical protein [Thermoactinomyces]MBA4552760.1 hypothetical protein [Thermoactinomyces vulgaris]MBA4597798.1 hypothetical protein [Thermoactinomyces vulgaris]MBH8584493.1 hypothetical protein [Thermoactinomyces sp. CICC 10735]MBH8587189.1 hypothetical protein [Thermoactinomyces sp. CICC 10520]MBH8589812.1 hypothetical protein [Thermoactinomyces vulgaris]
MFEVHSYIYLPIDAPDLDVPDEIEVTETSLIRKIDPYLDHNYLDGHIELNYYQEPILSKKQFDLIDQLWAELIDLTLRAIYDKESKGYFPDRPLEMEMKILQKGIVLFLLEEKKWYLPKRDFFLTIIDGGIDFFKHMNLGLSKENAIRYGYAKTYKECFTARSIILDYLKKNV